VVVVVEALAYKLEQLELLTKVLLAVIMGSLEQVRAAAVAVLPVWVEMVRFLAILEELEGLESVLQLLALRWQELAAAAVQVEQVEVRLRLAVALEAMEMMQQIELAFLEPGIRGVAVVVALVRIQTTLVLVVLES
jgi:hypothetical protein